MHFRFTKPPDTFELSRHLFVSNTVFQKMRSSMGVFFILFFFFLFSPVVGLQTDQSPWMKVLLLRASIQSCPAMPSLPFPLANDRISVHSRFTNTSRKTMESPHLTGQAGSHHHPVLAATRTHRRVNGAEIG